MSRAHCLALRFHRRLVVTDARARWKEERLIAWLEVECANSPSEPSAIEKRGPELWCALHSFAREWNGDLVAANAHLAALEAALPCGECRAHWRALLAAHPPDLRDAATFHRWTMDRHNDVNRRLGKPVL